MDTDELKKLVSKHFDYATPGNGQFLHGDWFTPKHKDALNDLTEELLEWRDQEARHEISELESDLEAAKSKVESLAAQVEELKEEARA